MLAFALPISRCLLSCHDFRELSLLASIEVFLTIEDLNGDRLLHVCSWKCLPTYIRRLNLPMFCMYCGRLLHVFI
jgi:hypothetical protein